MKRYIVRKSGDNFRVFDTRHKVSTEGVFATRKTAQKYADIDNAQHMLCNAMKADLEKRIKASRQAI